MKSRRYPDIRKLQTRLTEWDVKLIRDEVANGTERMELARQYGLSKQAIDRIIRRETFAWVLDNPETELTPAAEISPIEQDAADESFARLQERLSGEKK